MLVHSRAASMRALLLAAALVLPMTLASAQECEMRTSHADVELAGELYVVEDCLDSGLCFLSLWIYEESNGLAGLQRHDEVVDDTCDGAAGAGDTIVFF